MSDGNQVNNVNRMDFGHRNVAKPRTDALYQ